MSVLKLNDEPQRRKYKPLYPETEGRKPHKWRGGYVSQTWRSRGLIQKGALSAAAIRELDYLMDEALGDEAADAVEEMVAFLDAERKPITAARAIRRGDE
jgi:hypothetical protein